MNDKHNEGAGAVIGALIVLAASMVPTIAIGQTVPTPQDTARTIPGLVIATPTPTPTTTPVPIPTAPVVGLPTPMVSPTPGTTAPAARSTPTPRPSPARERPTAARPTPEPTPTSADTPVPAASPVIMAIPTPTPVAQPTAAPVARDAVPATDHGAWFWIAGVVALLLLALAGWALWRRRSAASEERWDTEPVAADPPAPSPMPPVVAPIRPVGPHARIAIALRPIRAGLNLLSATVEAEVIVTNTGDAPATQVRIHATLLSAHAGQEVELDAVFTAPVGRPAAPPFALAAGEERRVRIVAALAREAVRAMEAGGRPMFVPLIAIDVRYAADAAGSPARTGQAFVVGVERVDSAKLAPFWLDGPQRMHDQIAARVQGPLVID